MTSVVGYPTPGKNKALVILDAFCAGAKGRVSSDVSRLLPGGAAFYGVVPETKSLYRQAKAEQRDVYYLDNAYFDPTREVYFRATKGALQATGREGSDCKRFDRLGIPIAPWREGGEHILVCPQSDQFMRDVARYEGNWLADTLQALRALTLRPVRVRPWTGNKKAWYSSLPEDLHDCWALVTYSSASAITAILSGVPAVCTATDCISLSQCGKLEDIENPYRSDNRREWAGAVADSQWTLDEMRRGVAWRMLTE